MAAQNLVRIRAKTLSLISAPLGPAQGRRKMKRIISISIALLLFAGITLSAVYAHRHATPESVTQGVVTSNGPSGSVTFHSQRDGNFNIYRMNLDGSDERRITEDTAADTQPDLSPNGQQIVFVSN